MEIKNIREPNEKEKSELVPKAILLGVTTAILTTVIYMIDFHYFEKLILSKTVAQHDMVVEVFEFFYKRDYMLNKLEGLSISVVMSIISQLVVGAFYMVIVRKK